MRSAAQQFAGRKAAQASRDALRKAVDSLELTLLDRTIAAAVAEDERNEALEALERANDRVQKTRQERDASILQLRAMRAKGGAL